MRGKDFPRVRKEDDICPVCKKATMSNKGWELEIGLNKRYILLECMICKKDKAIRRDDD